MIGIVTGAIALGAGTLAASIVADQVLDLPFVFSWQAALLTVIAGGGATLGFGLVGAWSALAAKPAELLRNP